MHNDMESQIHYLEQVAYSSVLRAFKAQSDALTWEKEGLITELRKELRVSDDEHRELLAKVNADDIICRIREWRNAGGTHGVMLNIPQSTHEPVLPSPTISASRKRQKTFMPLSVHAQPLAVIGSGGKTPRPSPRYPIIGRTARGMLSNHSSSTMPLTNEHAAVEPRDPLIGRKVMTKWPDDNNFYEALIVDYNSAQGRHALVYDTNTQKESYEWVNLKEIPPEDIRWVGEDPGISHQIGRGGQGRGFRNPISHGIVPNAGRGRGTPRDQSQKGFLPSQNGVTNKVSDEIEILHTDTLIKEVEKVFDASRPDLLEIEKAKKMLKDHERALIDVLAKLADASDSGSDGEQQFRQGQAIDGERRSMHSNNQFGEVQMGGRADGFALERRTLTATDNQQEEYIDIV